MASTKTLRTLQHQNSLNLIQNSRPVVRLLYRSLLRYAKTFDSQPALKAFWERPVELREKSNIQQYYYTPTKSFAEEVRRRFREPLPLTSYDINKAHDLGFAALRSVSAAHNKFNNELALVLSQIGPPSKIVQQSPEPEQNILVETIPAAATAPVVAEPPLWAVPDASIRPGTFLIAHPLLNGYFKNSVILVCSHDPKYGTTGLVVNNKFSRMLGYHLFRRVKRRLAKNLTREAFSRNLMSGGPIRDKLLSALHSNKDIEEASPISSGIYLNRNPKIPSSELLKKPPLHNVRFFFGAASWTPGQLEEELKAGMWMTASASTGFVFQKPSKKNAAYETWRDILRCMGGEYSSFVDVPDNFWYRLHQRRDAQEEYGEMEDLEQEEDYADD